MGAVRQIWFMEHGVQPRGLHGHARNTAGQGEGTDRQTDRQMNGVKSSERKGAPAQVRSKNCLRAEHGHEKIAMTSRDEEVNPR
jgi:hypothetical protein